MPDLSSSFRSVPSDFVYVASELVLSSLFLRSRDHGILVQSTTLLIARALALMIARALALLIARALALMIARAPTPLENREVFDLVDGVIDEGYS